MNYFLYFEHTFYKFINSGLFFLRVQEPWFYLIPEEFPGARHSWVFLIGQDQKSSIQKDAGIKRCQCRGRAPYLTFL